MLKRPRRNRRTAAIRSLVQETHLSSSHLVLPAFVHEQADPHPISSMPGHSRLSVDGIVELARRAQTLGVMGLALFPVIADARKNQYGTESENEQGLLQQTIRRLKEELPNLVLFTDVALDPYSSDGHDGVVVGEHIDNELTVPILAR